MKLTTLAIALIGIATVLPVRANFDEADWSRSELLWNEEYDTYVVAPTLKPDIFQERLVWSDHYTEFVPVAMAYMAELRDYHEQKVWSEQQGAFVLRASIEPCPKLGAQTALMRVAGLR